MTVNTEFITFPRRLDRSRFVAGRFRQYLGESLLDVGCYEAPLREILSNVRYTGVDIVGNPDLTIDLETTETLPFDDSSFDCVTCIDVLEHLDNMHRVFDQLIRVTRRYAIVSLPNCWRDARRPIERGAGKFAHYDLPFERPVDRHKWFFNLEQIQRFYEGQAKRHGVRLVELFATEKPSNPVLRTLRRLRYPGRRYRNRYCQTLWVVYEKPQPLSAAA